MRVPLLVNDFLERAVRLYAEREAVVDGQHRSSYAQFGARCYQLANALAGAGVGMGDRVGIVSPNTHYFLESFFATAALGAILVPLNYRLVAEDFAYCLSHAGARIVLADFELTQALDSVRSKLNQVDLWVATGPGREGWEVWDDWVAPFPTTKPPLLDLDEDDLVSINYTSGTTARPKGVMLTHRNFYTNAYNFIAHFGITHHDAELWTLPMFHCNGWGGVYAITAMGAKHVIIRRPDPESILEAVACQQVTFACMAPVVLARLLDYPERTRFDLTTRPRVACAGAAPAVAHVRRLEEEMGWTFMQLYGLTETSPILTVAEVKPHLDSQGERCYQLKARAGHPALGVDLRVVDSAGEDVPANDTAIGEVAARGNMVFKGYWNQPEETAKVVRDGYFFTGDMATVSADGSINIVDRSKDVIISGGENISSLEIEDVLYRHPAVQEVAVIGVPDEQWGETPLALVVYREGHQEDDLRAFCLEQMAHFKVPSRFLPVSELPRTATGKLKKYELREPYWQGETRRVH